MILVRPILEYMLASDPWFLELVFQIRCLADLLASLVGQQMLTDRSSPVLIKMALLFDLCLPLCLSEGFDYFEPIDVYRLLS